MASAMREGAMENRLSTAAVRAVVIYGGPRAVPAGADIKRGQRKRSGRYADTLGLG